MMKNINYPYAKGNLLEIHNTYFYTKYEGLPFFKAWKKDRDEAIDQLGGESISPLKSTIQSHPKDLIKNLETQTIKTWDFLEFLYGSITIKEGVISSEVWQLVDLLVKKFEVTKRIFVNYSKGLKVDRNEDFKNLELYIRTAEIFSKSYSITRNLPYLNALLKCIDTLCAMRESLGSDLKGRLVYLVLKEREHVQFLSNSIGIQI